MTRSITNMLAGLVVSALILTVVAFTLSRLTPGPTATASEVASTTGSDANVYEIRGCAIEQVDGVPERPTTVGGIYAYADDLAETYAVLCHGGADA